MSQTELQAFVQKAITLDVQERIELINFLVKSLPLTEIKSDNIDDIKKINSILKKIETSEQLEYCNIGIHTVREALKNDTWWKELGYKEGIEKGIETTSKDIALKLLQNNIPLEIIINSTGLSKEDLDKLKATNNLN